MESNVSYFLWPQHRILQKVCLQAQGWCKKHTLNLNLSSAIDGPVPQKSIYIKYTTWLNYQMIQAHVPTYCVGSVWIPQRTSCPLGSPPLTWVPSSKWWSALELPRCSALLVATLTQKLPGSRISCQSTHPITTDESSSSAQVTNLFYPSVLLFCLNPWFLIFHLKFLVLFNLCSVSNFPFSLQWPFF